MITSNNHSLLATEGKEVEIMGEYEKTPSPEKVEEVLDFTDLELEFTDLQESFEDELAEIEERMAGAAVDLPKFKQDEDGKTMQLVSQKYIRVLMKSPPLSKPLPDYSIEASAARGSWTSRRSRPWRGRSGPCRARWTSSSTSSSSTAPRATPTSSSPRTPRGVCPLHPGTN